VPEGSERLRESCERIRAEAEAVRDAARARADAGLRERCNELAARITAHIELVGAQLSPMWQRRLQHDHHRMLQLARAIALAADDADLPSVQAAAGRLHGFMLDHMRRESSEP